MIVLVLGFATANVREEPQLLYLGTDADAANKVLLAPPKGIERTEIFKNPRPDRRRYHTAPEVVQVVPAAEPAPEETADEPAAEDTEEQPENVVDLDPDVPMPAGSEEKPKRGKK